MENRSVLTEKTPDINLTLSNHINIIGKQNEELILLVDVINQMKDKISIILKPKESYELKLYTLIPSVENIDKSELSELNQRIVTVGEEFDLNVYKIREIRLFIQNLINNLDL
jgi:CII-binding regulator of phage lambda lysogenization HflD